MHLSKVVIAAVMLAVGAQAAGTSLAFSIKAKKKIKD
jgi:hypothetical protein